MRAAAGASAVACVGQLTHGGSVTAALEWGDAHHVRALAPSRPGSHEARLHALSLTARAPSFALDLRVPAVAAAFRAAGPALSRYVGVIYRADFELASHYVSSAIERQYDALVWVDSTTALAPLDAPLRPGTPELGEFPFGL